MKQACMDLILQPMIDDLKQLSTEGVTISVSGKEHKVYSALATFSADNLSAHMISGYSMCFTSGWICPYRMATYSEMNHKYQEDNFVLRMTEIQEYQCVQHNKEHAALYGVRGKCLFDSLGYFDVTKCSPRHHA